MDTREVVEQKTPARVDIKMRLTGRDEDNRHMMVAQNEIKRKTHFCVEKYPKTRMCSRVVTHAYCKKPANTRKHNSIKVNS